MLSLQVLAITILIRGGGQASLSYTLTLPCCHAITALLYRTISPSGGSQILRLFWILLPYSNIYYSQCDIKTSRIYLYKRTLSLFCFHNMLSQITATLMHFLYLLSPVVLTFGFYFLIFFNLSVSSRLRYDTCVFETIQFVTLSPTILLFNVQRQCTLMSH